MLVRQPEGRLHGRSDTMPSAKAQSRVFQRTGKKEAERAFQTGDSAHLDEGRRSKKVRVCPRLSGFSGCQSLSQRRAKSILLTGPLVLHPYSSVQVEERGSWGGG
jgi:hypothetical protein